MLATAQATQQCLDLWFSAPLSIKLLPYCSWNSILNYMKPKQQLDVNWWQATQQNLLRFILSNHKMKFEQALSHYLSRDLGFKRNHKGKDTVMSFIRSISSRGQGKWESFLLLVLFDQLYHLKNPKPSKGSQYRTTYLEIKDPKEVRFLSRTLFHHKSTSWIEYLFKMKLL